ncbi:MAG: tetratricopeptide repeat protein [Stenotrophomonas sp.]|uniref:tetratricopeptide repeat protein n=1 Tax=Stenotrophomonas sp. TaxID=69392 RepID=UPI003D6D11E5
MVIPNTAVFAALAAAIILGVLAWVLWPLRGQRNRLWVTVVVVLGVAPLALYRLVGTPTALEHTAPMAPQSLEQSMTQLKADLERNPAQPEGWALLARSQSALGDAAGASESFARAVQLAPDQPTLLADAAESRALADPQHHFDPQAVQWSQKAIALQRGHPRATWFLGVTQRQAGQPAEAAKTWESLLGAVDAAAATSLRKQINEARAEAGMSPLAAGDVASPAPAVTSTHALKVKVSLDPAFAARMRLPSGASVFVIAHVPSGPPMPVAVERHALQDLPLDVVLDDSDSPMPTRALSTLQEVEVFARLSASGNSNREEGDVESAPVRVILPATHPVELVIGGRATR